MSKVSTQTLLHEDFSRFTGGTEDIPGEEIAYENNYHIPEEMTSVAGWTGGGIFPAAGSVALMDRAGLNQLGFISTPAFDLGGTATLTFRARLLPGSESGSLWIALCDDYYGPGDDQIDIELTNEWQEYSFVATHGSTYEPSYFQIQAEKGYVQLDDVNLDFKRDRLQSPNPLRAINVSPTEFIARWEDSGAPCYRLNVLCKEEPVEVESGSIVETFDKINVNSDGKTINVSEPNYPKGWEINLSENGNSEVSTEAGYYHSAPLSLHFDAVGDMIVSEETPQPIDGFKFWIRPSSMTENEEILSLLRIELYHSLTGIWDNVAHLPYYWMSENGDFYEFSKDALGDDVTKVRMSMIQKGDITFFVDDVTLSYSTQGRTFKYIEDLDVNGTEYEVSGINPVNEYTYYVQAVDEDLISEPSYTIWVDGIEGLQTEVLEPTNITPNSFTANWKALGHATEYRVETNRIIKAEADMRDVVVNEESFDGILSDGYDWQSPYNFADNGMAHSGWCATQPQWKPGMAGTQGTSWYGTAGLVFSPYLNLSCNGNEGFYVESTVETTQASVKFEDGTESPETMFVMVLESPNDSQALCSAYFETPTVGVHTATVFVPNPEGVDLSNVIVAFMNMSGTAFYVDHVKITQDIRSGEELITPYSVAKTSETSLKVDIESGYNYAYTVTASTSHNYENYTSEKSEVMTVNMISVGVNSISEDYTVSISTIPGKLNINASASMPYTVFGANGIIFAEGSGSAEIALTPGLYLVKYGSSTTKVIVK
ncbi:MAG: hypothetical protein NC548_57040 [Lachnospiraceae bacterium]|nr:hypothetical protein [Lachnospiraceae bacterium]